jgi:hypothetical protein
MPVGERRAPNGRTPMLRQHFRLVADALAEAHPCRYGAEDPVAHAAWWRTCEVMARRLRATNSAFDRERFLVWCAEG